MTAPVEIELFEAPEAADAAPLVFSIAGSVATTVDPGNPVVSELRLSIGAPPVPPDGTQDAPDAGVVYLTFPWGAGPSALCSELEAQAITVTPDVDARHWTVVRGSSPSTGTYWMLGPPSGGGPEPGGTCGFVIGNIISQSAADLPPTLCFASCWHATGGTVDQVASPTFWRAVPLAITALEVSAPPTPGRSVKLAWRTTGATGCSLGDGAHDLPPVGELPITVEAPRTFELTATSSSGAVTTRRLRVAPPRGWTRLSHDPVVTQDGPIVLPTPAGVVCVQPSDGSLLASRDGRTWEPRPYGLPDRLLGAAGCRWNRSQVVIGGQPARTADAATTFVVRSRDGTTWSALPPAQWSQPAWHGCAAYAGLLWVLGGTGTGQAWSSPDGRTWTAPAAPPWTARVRPGIAVHDGALWLSGGLTSTTADAGAIADLWRLGFELTWEQHPAAPPWSGERALTLLASVSGRLHALVVPLGEAAAALWALTSELEWEPAGAGTPVRTNRLLGLRVGMTPFHGGLLVVTDAGSWWFSP